MNPVREIVCSKVDCGRNGRDPKDISVSCSCVDNDGRRCKTRQYCWQDVEYYHEKYCSRDR
uniref:Uncharacterized protein n=1 Tax=Romanomermis culicivorax TaxID=13658 RepID=A0A915KYX7_ROMCU